MVAAARSRGGHTCDDAGTEKAQVAIENPQPRDADRRRLYEREEALLRRLQAGEDTPELQAELASVREAIRRSLRQEDGGVDNRTS